MRNTAFLSNALGTWYFRSLVLVTGAALFLFYAILLLAAVVNLPLSWFGVIYSLFGVAASIACFVYVFRPRSILLVVIVPAVVLMVLTLKNSSLV